MVFQKTKYRSEIDGLRALAVFSVIIYHAKITIFGEELLPGGYLGVDIFFIISGYLISKIILNELIKNQFSFIYFYNRRVRRILPLLFFVISASLPVAYVALLPNSLIEFCKSILFSIGFSSNFYFYFSGLEYVAIDSIFNPFLHTWSLSVEEQFYLIYPLMLFVAYYYLRKKILIFLIFVFSFSFILAIIETDINASRSFYFIHTRIWELILGCIVAVLEFKKKFSSKYSKFLVNIAFIVLLLTLFLFNEETNHPSYNTLLPVFCVSIILLFIKNDQIIFKILSFRILVFFGLISYSLYMWHYPIFAFYRVYFLGTPYFSFFFDKLIIVFSLILISILSYFLIERYFRNKNVKFYKVLIFLTLNFFIIIFFSYLSFYKNGFESRIPNEIKKKLSIINFYTPEYRNCFVLYDPKKINDLCKFGKYSENVVLVGDSRSAFLANDLKQKILKSKLNFFMYTKEKIRFDVDNVDVNSILANTKKLKDSIIVINGVYNNPNDIFKFSEQKNLFKDYFKLLINNNNKIIFLSPIPIIDNPYNFSQGNMRLVNMFKEKKISEFKIDKKIHINDLNEYNIFKQFIESELDEVYFLDLDKIFCDKTFCYSIKDGYLLLQDKLHQSGYAATLINNRIIQKINEIRISNQ